MNEVMFKKGKIGNMVTKNRVYLAPMGTSPAPDGGFTEIAARYFEERAKGGVGLLLTGINMCTTKYEGLTGNELSSKAHIERLAIAIERCHNYGSKVAVQIGPGYGRIGMSAGVPISASPCDFFWAPEVKCRPLEKEEIKDLVKKMGESAILAKQAGADAIEIHAYGGYLLDQFMSTHWNWREDEYGGSFENRMRFLTECILEVKKACGKNMPILVKFSAVHNTKEGRKLEEGIEIAKYLENLGVDALHVDAGCYECWWKSITDIYTEPAFGVDVAAEIKKAVSIPVMANGKVNDPKTAKDLLNSGKVDYVGMGHQLIADPHWVNKVKEGRTYDIVPCIGCNECMHAEINGDHYHCSVNPTVCAEDIYKLTPATDKKSVLVIGGGPGGMSAALAAAQRGFDVELWEKSDVLGGNLIAAGMPPHKKEVLKFVTYLKTQLYKHNVKVRMLKEADVESILAMNADHVILAAGASSVVPPIPGVEKAVSSSDVLEHKVESKGNTVIIGGGLVGCETALLAAESAASVTIVEMLEDIMLQADHCVINSIHLRTLLAEANVNIKTSCKVKKIDEGKMLVEMDGNEVELPCDTVILAAGYKPNNALEDALEGKVKQLTVIGDASRPRKIMTAVHEGYHAIRTMQ